MSQPNSAARFLNLDGVVTAEPPKSGTYLQETPIEGWRLSVDDRTYAITDLCHALDRGFRQAIMTTIDYELGVGAMPQFVSSGGLSAECPLGSDLFEQFLAKFGDRPDINKFLYLYDCERLVSSISQCLFEVTSVMGDFYLALNTAFVGGTAHLASQDGVVVTRSAKVTQLLAYLSFIFIRLHSLLDYSVKLALEAEKIQSRFERYPRMTSRGAQFGDRKRVRINGAAGTLFESCEFIDTVETLRNHLIHDGLIDEQPKLYERLEKGEIIERFVLFPDMAGGRFSRFGNRNLFYGSEDKINLRLPDVILEFQRRLEATLGLVCDELKKHDLGAGQLTA